jgi:hypothetical protein
MVRKPWLGTSCGRGADWFCFMDPSDVLINDDHRLMRLSERLRFGGRTDGCGSAYGLVKMNEPMAAVSFHVNQNDACVILIIS